MPPVSLLGLLRFSAVVASFGTINEPILLGQHNEHEMITRLAFQCPSGQKSDGICFEPRSLDQLAGYHRDVLGLAIPGAGFNGAVGAPDTLDLVPEGPEAHCDDADYLDIPGYPQTRAEATANLHACVEHLRGRFRQAWVAAGRLLDERKRIRPAMVELSNPFGDCTFAFPALQGSTFARAKCSVLEGFGRALHGIQDFYSHSNWADNADPKLPISVSNPPGLGRTDAAPFLDLRARGVIPPDQIPLNLTTGCFALPDTSPGSGECAGRITHYALNKDAGLISLDGSIGEMGPVSPRSEAVPSNFRLAVHAAIQSSRYAWGDLREEMRLQYGAVSGNLIICSLVRDDPIKDCRNRTVAVVVDKSWESSIEGGIQLERSLAKELNSRLTLHGLDRVAVIEFDESARLVYPMGYPISATFDFSEPGGQRRIDSGIKLAMAETIHAQPETYSDRGAILLLTTGSESGQSAENTLIQLRNATEEGVRVHYGCVSPAGRWNDHAADTSGGTVCSLGDALVPAVLKTGGIVAFIHSHGPITLGHFINLVMDRGLTATDAKDAAEHTRVYPGISVFDLLSDQYPTKSFVYPVSAGENLNFTIQSTVPEGLDTTGCFSVALWNKGLEIKIATYTSCCSESPLSLVYEATAAFDLMLVAEHGDTTGDSDEGEIVFMLELDTSKPDKNETRTTRSIEILSTSTIVELAGSTTRTVLTSETLEVISGTAIAGGSTSTFSQCFRADNDGGPFYHSSSEPKPTCGMETISATTMASNLTSASRSSPGHSPLVYT